MSRCVPVLGLLLTFLGAARVTADPPKKVHTPKMSFLDNRSLRLGVDLHLGGAITHLSLSAKGENVVNNFDWGRQIQMSYYSGPVPYVVGEKRPSKHWEHLGWNPVQAGDDHGNPAKVLDHRNDGKTLYVKCVPMQWPLNNEPGECTFETWITLEGVTAQVRCRLTNARADRTQYGARMQELPAVYTNGPYYRLFTYTGARPFTGDSLTRIEKKKPDGFPWSSWTATENWAALVNDENWGLGVWHPGCYSFSGGFAGKPGKGGTKDSPTGYLAPNRIEILDHNICHEYHYVLILDKLDAIRKYVGQHAQKLTPPSYQFARDRQGWWYNNAHDTGWPIKGELNVLLEKGDPQLISPAGFWHATGAPLLTLEAAFQTREKTGQIFWSTLEHPGLSEERSVSFPIQGDGQMRLYTVKLADSVRYRGVITGVRIDPVPQGHRGDWVRIRQISFSKERKTP